MKMPPFAPSRPAVNEPSVLITLPLEFSSAVASPRYQTVPDLSWAYQSLVRSVTRPPWMTRSWTTLARTPAISLVLCVTVRARGRAAAALLRPPVGGRRGRLHPLRPRGRQPDVLARLRP